jgi:hypothetical protein
MVFNHLGSRRMDDDEFLDDTKAGVVLKTYFLVGP